MIPVNDRYKQRIAAEFGQAAPIYNAYATLQKACATHLLQIISEQSALPSGDILEMGCGTGLITQGLIQQFPDRILEITDLSPEMVRFCHSNLIIPDSQLRLISFHPLDAERIKNFTKSYAAIVGGLVIQWFRDPVQSLNHLINYLYPQGKLIISFPTCHSFPEWKQVCRQLNLPFTANPLPDPAVLSQALPSHAHLCHIETLEIATVHASAADFFRELKAIGAGVNQTQKQLSVPQMKSLIQHWDAQASGPVQVHYQIAYWVVERITND